MFSQSALGRRVDRAARVEREFDFLLAVEDLVVRGQVDLWFEEGGELVIVDYKTDAVTAVEAHQRARDYALQLRLYAMAVERVAGRSPDRAWLHFLRPNTVVEVDLCALAAGFARTGGPRTGRGPECARVSAARKRALPALRVLPRAVSGEVTQASAGRASCTPPGRLKPALP